MASFNKGLTPECLSQARDFFERSLALDPGNISAQVGAAAVHVMAANTIKLTTRLCVLRAPKRR